jgi:asparagine synthase (glutamine-hydrolysing)
MCGILGWLRFDGQPHGGEDLARAESALETLAQRGPDSAGRWHEGNVYMGHRRLSIIDLSDAANQPFVDASGRYVLSFNGLIYNYLELRAELEAAGCRFRTESDTEVMLMALITWGNGALDRFDGMYAAALHDRHTGQHQLFRDPLGQKPLYVHVSDGAVIYASELRALLAIPGFGWRIDRRAFAGFMMNGYYAREETPIKGIRKLLPGCRMMIDKHGRCETTRYWNSLPGKNSLDISEPEAIQTFEDLFAQSCQRALRSDVPYGVFLSGGIDSSLVLSYCRDFNADIRTFTVAMGEADFDESGKADRVASQLGIQHKTEFAMDDNAVVETLEKLLGVNDEPHGDPGFVNAFFLAQSASPLTTVALAGDGGDELFAGYLPFRALAAIPILQHLPESLLAALKLAVRHLPESDGYIGWRFKSQSLLRGFPAADAVRLPLFLAAMDPEDMAELSSLDAEFFDRAGAPGTLYGAMSDLMAPMGGSTRIQQLLYFYQNVFLPEFVCMHTDRAAMQFGLEVRSPFLSPELVKFANRLPDHYKIRGGDQKWLLKQVATKRHLPWEIVHQKKQGFTFPIARWLKTTLRPMMEDLINDRGWDDDNLIDPAVLRRIMEGHITGYQNNYRILFNMMVFRAWRRRYPEVRPN